MDKNLKVMPFNEFINERYNEHEVSDMTWQEAVAEATSTFESRHNGGVEKVAKLIGEFGEENADEIYGSELYTEASSAIADPAYYLGIELSNDEHAALEKISNEDSDAWQHQCKEAVSNSPHSEAWFKIIEFIVENGY